MKIKREMGSVALVRTALSCSFLEHFLQLQPAVNGYGIRLQLAIRVPEQHFPTSPALSNHIVERFN